MNNDPCGLVTAGYRMTKEGLPARCSPTTVAEDGIDGDLLSRAKVIITEGVWDAE